MQSEDCSKKVAVLTLNTKEGFEDVTHSSLKRWENKLKQSTYGTINKKRGKPIDHEFEAAVMNKLIVCALTERVGPEHKLEKKIRQCY